MVITKEEAKKIKKHLLGQLENFPEERRLEIKNQINSMTNEEIEIFIEKNNLTHLGGKCIFCSIVAGKTNSYKIASDSKNIAILELNPLSKGHSLIVPKEHLEKMPDYSNQLAQEVAVKLKDKFNPQEIKLNEIEIMGHAILEIIPIYGNESERKQATEEELKEIQKELKKVKEIEIKKKTDDKPIEKKEGIPILPPRIP